MNDRYLDFVASPFGKFLSGAAGLPQPTPLERFAAGKPDILGPVLVGAAPGAALGASVAAVLAAAPAASLFHPEFSAWMGLSQAAGVMSARFIGESSGTVGSAVFDASGIDSPAGLSALYRFFHDTVKAVARNGRIVVLGTTPELTTGLGARVAQRALEGVTRSLGKEAKRNITVALIYVDPGAQDAIGSTLSFYLSPRCAYVSGQVVRVGAAAVPAGISARAPHAGRTVLVTGASRGIGAAIAEVFARDGAKVICLDVPQAAEHLLGLAQKIGGDRFALDITAPDAAAAVVADAQARGGYDVVVHNAGITRDKTIAKMTPALLDSVIAVNLQAPVTITGALLEAGALKANGRVVCVSSIGGIAGNLGQTNYAASKAGIIGLVGGLAPVLAELGGTINAVAPGFIETQMTAAMPVTIREAGRRMNSMGQGGLPEDVAEAIGWFAHPGSGGVNGQIVRVCGQSLIGA